MKRVAIPRLLYGSTCDLQALHAELACKLPGGAGRNSKCRHVVTIFHNIPTFQICISGYLPARCLQHSSGTLLFGFVFKMPRLACGELALLQQA